MSRWLSSLILILMFILASSNCTREETAKLHSESSSSPSSKPEHEQSQWLTFNDGLARAWTAKKPIFVEFYTEWCVACKAFHRETLDNENVAKMLTKNFVSVRINAEEENDRLEYRGKYYSSVGLSSSFGVTVYPSLVFLDSGGQSITKIHGFVRPTQFSAILNYINQKCYETKISFQEFAKKGKCS